MANDSLVARYFQKYRSIIVCISVLLFAQAFFALRVCVFQTQTVDTLSGRSKDSKSHIYSYAQGSVKNEIQNSQAQNPVIKAKPSSPSPTLKLESLNFTPECDITLKESISAIERAKTQQCKEQLAKTACGIQRGTLYPKRLPRFCHNPEYSYGTHLGCYQDEKNKRLLNNSFALRKETNSPQSCIDLCLQSGFLYAGLQYSVECFCGNQRPPDSLLIDPTLCYMMCPGLNEMEDPPAHFKNASCGGYYTMDLYETGVLQYDESKNVVYGLQEISEVISDNSLNETVRIVFLLTVNGRALRQVTRFIKALFHERHYFYIHVDARQDYLYRELLGLRHKLPHNVRFMGERKGSIWGGASLLTVLLNSMTELIHKGQEWNWSWDYVINLSESDFPLKSMEKLEAFLTLNKGKNFVKSHGRDVLKFIQKQGLDKTFDECEFRMWRMGDRILPVGILMDGGSDWVALHKDFVDYVVNSKDDLVKGLKTIFKYTLLPAESFFHTALRNSALCQTFVDNNLHVTNWKRKLGCKCQYRNIVDWCGCSPNDFRLADWNRLQMTESRLIFFGRKFESVVNQGILNQLETTLYPNRYQKNFATLDRYWQSIYHHYDLTPRPDEALVSLGHSLARIAVETSFKSSQSEFSYLADTEFFVHLIEISTYLQEDVNQGILVRFEFDALNADTGQGSLQLEAWFSQQKWLKHNQKDENMSKFRKRILNLRIGTDYDQKEQIFRNFAGAMGPKSEPTLAYSCLTDEPFNITFVWENPYHSIQSRQNVSVGIGETANFIKPTFRTRHIPGDWTVKLFDVYGLLIAQTQYLIIPISRYNPKESVTLSRRPKHQRDGEDSEEQNETNSLRLETDGLVSGFYLLHDMCLAREIGSSGTEGAGDKHRVEKDSLGGMTLCSHTQWSSLFPDPKSTISGIDTETGLLIP